MSAPTTINGKEVFDLLRDDLAALEDEFGRDTVSGVQAITEIGEYLRAGGGKRIRPTLLLLSAKLLDYQGQGAVRLGAVVEIIHTATLVHDDIIDEAKTRRGRPAANTQWGNSKCVLAGDWLYMQAFKIAVQERNFRILDTLIELTQHMVLGGATAEQEASLGQYGHNLGMAFQIVDDVLDLTASEEVLGKSVASDLREGKATMAVIHTLERSTPEERSKIETVLCHGAFNGVTHAEILEILQRYGSLDAATARAAYYAESAQKSICTFPDSEIKRALLWAPEFVVAREK